MEWTIFLLNEEHRGCNRGFRGLDLSSMKVLLQEGIQLCLCHDLAKRLSHYLYFFSFLFFFFFFFFILGLLHRRKCGKVSRHKCHTNTVTSQEVTASHHMMSHDESHDKHGEIVHRPCSSCISSVENPTRTPSSSPCQTLIKEQLA